MKCYKCNSQLDNNSDYCLKCGADVSVYKIVVRTSNTYYNQGLEKARVRDLSGAVESLRTSLSINKNNIKARNLLGLVYFEMGEVVMALSEWVVSKNLKPDRNIAEVYIKKVQDNPNKLDMMNQAIKRFNISLRYAKEGATDMAVIQLKKVVTMNPKLTKAGLLLGLLLWKDGQTDRAKRCLQKVLKTDRNNTLALRYISELDGTLEKDEENTPAVFKKKKNVKQEAITGHDVIIPPNSYKEPSNGIFTVLSILLGVVLGAALVWFLIVPAKISSLSYDNKQLVIDYSEQLAANSVDIANLKSQVKSLTTEKDNLSKQLAGYTGEDGESGMYSLLMEAADAYVNYDFAQALILLQKIDVALLPTQTAKDVYNAMLDASSGGADRFYSQGTKAYLEKDYVSAANYFEAALIYDETNDEAAYYLGLCRQETEDAATAEAYYEEFLAKFPQSGFAADVSARLAALRAGQLEQQPTTTPPQTQPETQATAPAADDQTQQDTETSPETQQQEVQSEQETQPQEQETQTESESQPESDSQEQ